MARRRRILIGLAGFAVACTAVAIVIDPLGWLVQAVTVVVLVLYVVHLRLDAVRRKARAQAVSARAERARAAQPAVPATVRTATRSVNIIPPSTAVVIERQQDGSWLPVPVPLPTYVEAPPAPRPPADRVPTEEELDRKLDELERRLAVNE